MRRTAHFTILALTVAALSALFAEEAAPVYEINFGLPEQGGALVTRHELELWARNRNMLVRPDSPRRNLQDELAEVIPETGLEFTLDMPGTGRAYLYLDLVGYEPLSEPETGRVHWLEVFANGKLVATLYQGGGAFLQPPIAVLIEREHAMDRKLRVLLRPSPGDGTVAIWDAYVSRYLESP